MKTKSTEKGFNLNEFFIRLQIVCVVMFALLAGVVAVHFFKPLFAINPLLPFALIVVLLLAIITLFTFTGRIFGWENAIAITNEGSGPKTKDWVSTKNKLILFLLSFTGCVILTIVCCIF